MTVTILIRKYIFREDLTYEHFNVVFVFHSKKNAEYLT